jgi:hypothetical protein
MTVTNKDAAEFQKLIDELTKDNKKLALQVEDQKNIDRRHRKLNGELHQELTESKKKECKCDTKTSTSS